MYFPGRLPKGRVIDQPVMAIDLLPTITELCGARLPEKPIDGQNIWPLLNGNATSQADRVYFFYYRVNELHALRKGDWKLVLPHRYRSMEEQAPGKDGLPGSYTHFDLQEPELYQLAEDPQEVRNLADARPEVVDALQLLADSVRLRLGDALTGIEGLENRPPGRIPVLQKSMD
jgi:arylsulfatase